MSRRDPLDFAAIGRRLAAERGPTYWRSLEELAEDPSFVAFCEAEFPSVAPQLDRRRFLQLMGASLAFGGLAACGKAPETAVPYVEQPELIVPGETRLYATAVDFAGYLQPVLGRTQAGRPTKLEGNPDHPACRGAASAITQAAILQLYDPDRSQAPRYKGRDASWEAFLGEAAGWRERWDASAGQGLHLLLGASSSPTLARELERWLARWPQARLYRFEPYEGRRYAAADQAFGRPLERHLHLEKAELLLCFEDDLLGSGPQQVLHASRWGERRRAAAEGRGQALLIAVESCPSLTGAKASERRIANGAEQNRLLRALLAEIDDGPAPELAADEQHWVRRMAAALRAHAGRCLISAGARSDAATQAAVYRLNDRLGNLGHTLSFSAPLQQLEIGGQPLGDLGQLCAALGAGEVQSLLALDCNPAYQAPAEAAFAAALEALPWCLHAGQYYDETASHSHWHLPLSHPLEAWHDGLAADGTPCLGQPLIEPLHATRSASELLALLRGEPTADSHAQLRETWQSLDEAAWRAALERGFIEGRQPTPVAVSAAPVTLPAVEAPGGYEVLIRPDEAIWDGRFANLGWLQELPRPLSKLTWSNAVAIAPRQAERLGLRNGDRVRVEVDGGAIEGAVILAPGQHPDVLELRAGYGRRRMGRVAVGQGFDVAPLRRLAEPWRREGARLAPLDGTVPLAITQMHHSMKAEQAPARRLPREVARQPATAAEQPSFYPATPAAPPPAGGPLGEPRWGMLIDLDQCIGCNACVVACQAENNVPVVGAEQVAAGRAMHWLRVDHYYEGSPEAPRSSFLPVPCMHCEHAPCEMGCPVNATVHGPEGLNQMVYNRCIGTRTCASYCPYKVRRFNWFDWTGDDPPLLQAQRNPNVTVRGRGVMEKCTYCVQRISEARIDARMGDRPIASQTLQTACQQTCPTQAIVFGDLSRADSGLHYQRETRRHYALLEELNTRPRTTYLAALEDGLPQAPADETPEGRSDG